jgi:hypothetical protein
VEAAGGSSAEECSNVSSQCPHSAKWTMHWKAQEQSGRLIMCSGPWESSCSPGWSNNPVLLFASCHFL